MRKIVSAVALTALFVVAAGTARLPGVPSEAPLENSEGGAEELGTPCPPISQPSTNVPIAIPDNGNINSTLNFPIAAIIFDIDVQVSITHTWDSDVRVALSSPSVPAQVLWQNCGGSSDNFTNTLIDQEAATPLPCTCTTQAACNAFQGTFNNAAVPGAGNLSAFDGTSALGVWTLNVADDSAICTGTLTAWSLTVVAKNICPVELLEYRIEGS